MTSTDHAATRGKADAPATPIPLRGPRRALFALAVGATGIAGIVMMFEILRANGITVLEWVILGLFAVTFTWIATGFWSAIAGFVADLFRLDPISLRPLRAIRPSGPVRDRTAIVMPVYNEEPARVIAGLESTWRSLQEMPGGERFDAFLLSDTTDPGTARAEEAAWWALRARVPAGERVHYRRRGDNTGRKPGNIAEFCRRWGGRYDHMVVLDADSVMTGDALVDLVRAMQADPAAGIIQTVPLPTRQVTLFGRFVQFAARVFSHMLAHGLSFWQTDTANYWGHNAIVRMRAFTETCGLPSLPGRPPLGGEILSHDFVEAALMRRAGWRVLLRPDIRGSYEEVPSNMLDFAKRDRRWVQGNLQHLRLLFVHGLHPVSRLHFLMGAIAYVSSLFWLLMLSLSTIDAIARALQPHHFFSSGAQLFPDWPIAKTDEIMSLLAITLTLLILPKLLGAALALLRSRHGFGGTARLLAGTAGEIVLAILIAPIMMSYHAWFVLSVLAGRNARWEPQARTGRAVPWREALRRSLFALCAALAWGGATYALTPQFFWWLTPVLTGLVLAPAIVVWSSHLDLGRALARGGIFATPEASRPPPALARVDAAMAVAERDTGAGIPGPSPLPVEQPLPMPVQHFDDGPHWRRPAPATA